MRVEHRLRRDVDTGSGPRRARRPASRAAAASAAPNARVRPLADQAPHDPLALGDEPAALGVEVALLELPVVGEPRIVGDRGPRRAAGSSTKHTVRDTVFRRRFASDESARDKSEAMLVPAPLPAGRRHDRGARLRERARGAARRAGPARGAVGARRACPRRVWSRDADAAVAPVVPPQADAGRLRVRSRAWTAPASRTPSTACDRCPRRTRPSAPAGPTAATVMSDPAVRGRRPLQQPARLGPRTRPTRFVHAPHRWLSVRHGRHVHAAIRTGSPASTASRWTDRRRSPCTTGPVRR